MKKKFIATTALAATIVGGALAVTGPVAVAGAQSAGRPAQAEPTEGARPGPHRHHRRMALRGAVRTAAEAMGMKPADLVKELKAGKSIADVAQAKGVDLQTVKDALIAKGNARIDQALANKRITAEQAAKAKARLPEAVDKIVNFHKGDRASRPAN